MSDSAALSVLVLAWDEAAPAIRTVVAAAPAVGSLLVLLPPQPPAPATPPAAAPASSPVEAAPPAPAAAIIPPAEDAPPPSFVPAAMPSAATPVEAAATIPRAAATGAATGALAMPFSGSAPTPPAVRLLYLVDSPLAPLARTSLFQVPAAPYLGATPPASALGPSATLVSLPVPTVANEPVAPDLLPPVATVPAPPLGPAEATAPAASAAWHTPAEPATATGPAAAAPTGAAPEDTVPALADAAFRADEILDPDPTQELHPELAAAPPAPTRADAPALADQPLAATAATGPFGLRIPERLPALAEPAPPTRAAEPEESLPDEPAPAAPMYSAPDLNTQVIRYARQAVRAALAEAPFEAIYAPAWPTWLAALELRQRASCPLVLHLTALAAGRQPADTAAGWPAEIQRQALRQADLVLVETYSLARRLRRELGLASGAVRVVPAGDAAAIARALRRARRA